MIVTPAPYLPFLDPHKGKAPGLFALDPATWVEPDGAIVAQLRYRDRLIASDPGLVARALPGAEAAVAELTAALAGHLAEHHPGLWRRGAGGMRRPDGIVVPLDDGIRGLGRLAQEDWLILERRAGVDEYVLTAGTLCFPAFWSLPGKLGLALTDVHGPVPHYAERLAARVNRVFAALDVARPLQRLNFSVATDPELHCPSPHRTRSGEAPRHLRVERQTLRRLPETGAVVFGVKTYLTPLADLAPADRAALAARLGALDPDMQAYKGGADYLASSGV